MKKIVMVLMFFVFVLNASAQDKKAVSAQCVPPSIMLHSKDRWFLIERLIPWIAENGYNTITYQDYWRVISGESEMPEKPILLSIDDLSTSGINSYFDEMIDALDQADMTATLAINTKTAFEYRSVDYQAIAEYQSRGFEIATHTKDHALLPFLGRDALENQIGSSVVALREHSEAYVITLILPYGGVSNKRGLIDREIFDVSRDNQLHFVVGIARGRYIEDLSSPSYFVGRVGVDGYLKDTAWEIVNWHRYDPSCQ